MLRNSASSLSASLSVWGEFMEETNIGIASACRRELAKQNVKANCCRRALLGGLLINAAVEGETVTLTLDEPEAAETALRLLRQCWSVQGEALPLQPGGSTNACRLRSPPERLPIGWSMYGKTARRPEGV